MSERGAQLYLASTSPRRQTLLSRMGIVFERLPNEVVEVVRPHETPKETVVRLAIEKAEAGWHHTERCHDRPVLGADTVVVLGEQLFGKPSSSDDGIRMLTALAGNTHEVCSALALKQDAKIVTRLSVSRVTFAPLSDEEIAAYWESGEGLDKAGAYALQGIGECFVTAIQGSYSGIMGLSLSDCRDALKEFGIEVALHGKVD